VAQIEDEPVAIRDRCLQSLFLPPRPSLVPKHSIDNHWPELCQL
jgi:hypothetical protein